MTSGSRFLECYFPNEHLKCPKWETKSGGRVSTRMGEEDARGWARRGAPVLYKVDDVREDVTRQTVGGGGSECPPGLQKLNLEHVH